ncbi:MAG: helix-turn-helix transcriptional regulator [Gammaproteobacteria bacterium]|nr:helix-turn-helix transcriptional regulator [Gammaproteobacteria bacterium]
MKKNTVNLVEYKKIVGKRIRQARKMAGFNTLASLTNDIEDWSESRLGNYENGTSLPNPLDIKQIAKLTETNPCWISFGIGSIRSTKRDKQAIRHQNLTQICENLTEDELVNFCIRINLPRQELYKFINNPFLEINDSFSSKIESALEKRGGWMDEQHIENDGLSNFFPDDLREIMMIFSNMKPESKILLLDLAKTLQSHE